jgi:hypothetical protein
MPKTKRTNNDLQNRKLKIEQHKPPPTILFGEGDELGMIVVVVIVCGMIVVFTITYAVISGYLH